MLGSADYAIVIGDWRARRMVFQTAESQLVSVGWGRELCAMSKATAEFICDPLIANRFEPWAHTLTVYRNQRVVWHGIITKVTAKAGQIVVEAGDGARFFKARRVPGHRVWLQHDATQVMVTHVEDALSLYDACAVTENMATHESRIWFNGEYRPSECMVQEVVDDLTEQGLVWTFGAGTLIIGPVLKDKRLAQLADKDFDGDFTVVKNGDEVVTDAFVQGKGVWGQWGVESACGLVQSIDKADGSVRAEECENQARQIVEDYRVAPRRLTSGGGVRLLPTAPVVIEELIPGVTVPIASSAAGVTLAANLCLSKLDVDVDDGGESVKVTLDEKSVVFDPESMPDQAQYDFRSPYEREQEKKERDGIGSGAASDEDTEGVPPA